MNMSKSLFKSIGKVFSFVVIVVVFAVLLTSTLKGVAGNPSAKYIEENLKSAGAPFENSPERNRYAQLLALMEYNSTTLPVEVARIVLPDLGYHNGKYVGLYPPGFLLLSAPFYAVGKIYGYAQLATGSISIVIAMLLVAVVTSIGRKLNMGVLPSLVSVSLFLFGTSAWAYTTSIYQHLLTTLILLTIFRLILSKRSIVNAGFIWLLAFFAFLVDTPNVLFVTPFVLFMIFQKCGVDSKIKRIKISVSKSIIYGALFVLPLFTAWMFYNQTTYGQPIKLSQAVISVGKIDKAGQPVIPKGKKENNTAAFLNYNDLMKGSAVLSMSYDRGIFLYSPFIILAFLGIKSLLKKARNEAIVLFVTIVTVFSVYSAWGDPWGGWAFGPRYLIPVFGLASILLAQAIQVYRRNWLFLLALISTGVYSIGVNTLGAITTNQVPPYHEATGLHMKYNYLLNWDYLQKNVSGSFVFNTFFRKSISLYQYALGLFGVASGLFLTLLTGTILTRNKK